MAIVPTKSLNPEQAKRGQAVLQRILRDRFGGSQTLMANAIGIKQPTLWAALNGRKGIGGKILVALHAFDPAAHAELVGGGADITNDFTASAHVQTNPPAQTAHDELAPLRRHAAALLMLPPYDYPEAKAKEMVQAVLAFKHDTALEAEEVAALADHIQRTLDGLPARPSTLPPAAKATAQRELTQTREKRDRVRTRQTGKQGQGT